MTGYSPHLRILAQLMPTEEKEEKRQRLYTSLDMMEFSYSKEDKSIGLSEICLKFKIGKKYVCPRINMERGVPTPL